MDKLGGSLSLIQWSLSTMDKLGGVFVPYTVEPLYKGQVRGASLQWTSWGGGGGGGGGAPLYVTCPL